MIKSELSIVIDTSPEKVFARISNPLSSLEDVPNVVEVTDITGQGKEMSWRLVYKMAGMRLELKFTYAEYIPNELLTLEFKGGSNGKQVWKLTPQNGGCMVDVSSEYSIPIPLVGKIAELILKRQNEREWEAILGNIKARLETEAPVAVE